MTTRSGIQAFVAERWRWGVFIVRAKIEDTVKDLVKAINFGLGKLAETLERVQERVEYGPVPGAYFPVVLYVDTPTPEDGAAITFLPNSSQGIRIISAAISLSTQSDDSADVDVDIKYKDSVSGSWATILNVTPVTPTVTTQVLRNAAGDFTKPYYSATALRLDVSDWTNIPKGLMVLISCKNMGKIEPV